MNVRLYAARVIAAVLDGKSLSELLPPVLLEITDPRDRAFLQALCYGVCRQYPTLDVVLSFLLKKPMQEKDTDVYALILIGLYQLMYLRVPAHAAVSETVSATEGLKKSWARGFVNAVLREYLRSQNDLLEKIKEDEEAYFAHPLWWIEACKKSWPTQWQPILEANNMHPPFSLRVNLQKISRADYLLKCRAANLSATPILETTSGITLAAPLSVDLLPGFFDGEVSVQDGAAQLAVSLLDLAPGQRVLDACAAPGGKLVHILEQMPDLKACVAVEKDPLRMKRIHENLSRANVNATCFCADINHLDKWWDGELFDRILLDAPCSASGVIRRHPDIKLLRQPSDIPVFAAAQLQLLKTVWSLLKPGGKLVYATCSIFPDENVNVVKPFIQRHAEAMIEPIDALWGEVLEIGRQILPGQHNMDGFYYACLRK